METTITLKKEPSAKVSTINYDNLRKSSVVLRAINHKLRQQIIKLLEENKRMNVTDIYVKVRIEQSIASQHLGILRHAGIVRTERDGRIIYYSLNAERIEHISSLIRDLVHG